MGEANFPKCEELANDLLVKYGVTEPVVNVFQIAKGEGLELRFIKMPEKLQSVAGFLDIEKKIIFVNNDDPANRQMFTIAHELGHFKMEHKPSDYNVLLRQTIINGNYSPVEQEANCFAANILVPKNMAEEIINKYKITKDDIDLLAKMFGVSNEMMAFRMKKLNLWKIA
ncbi:MAG: ImmA/IrrE family metallo-endopeptidase [Patescibacteria group bacterium]|nr:ImmA/IrrE family metallo-endopeptidase [Patescibacteria group bacterium]